MSTPSTGTHSNDATTETWPALPLHEWRETYATLHMWTQIVGKIRLALTPHVNHWWNVTLHVTCRGLTTSTIHVQNRAFHIEFDFLRHRLHVETSDDIHRELALEPMSVAQFYRRLMDLLADLDIEVSIWPVPVEIPDPAVPFTDNESRGSYDAQAVERLHQIFLQVDQVFNEFRGRFIGKTSPVHFFWGAFDMAVTRFSGREAPQHPGGIPNVGDHVMHEAYSHEVSSAGFWPGGGPIDAPAFYSYAYPEPDGFKAQPVLPDAAYYDDDMREFILPYDSVRASDDPDAAVLQFLQTTYEAAALLGNWDRAALER